jgi:hypothetical protein
MSESSFLMEKILEYTLSSHISRFLFSLLPLNILSSNYNTFKCEFDFVYECFKYNCAPKISIYNKCVESIWKIKK